MMMFLQTFTWSFMDLFIRLFLVPSILIVLLAWFYSEWMEYQIYRQCKKQNLRYVRAPSQIFTAIFNKRRDWIENQLIDQNGSILGCNMYNTLTVIIADPEITQIVCNKEFTKFVNRRRIETPDPIFQGMIFNTVDDQWKRLRAVLSPAFSSGKLRKLKYTVDGTIKVLLKNLERSIANNEIVDIRKIMSTFSMDTITQMSFGVKIDSLHDPDNQMAENGYKMFNGDISIQMLFFLLMSYTFPSLSSIFGSRFEKKVQDYFMKYVLEILQKKRDEIKTKTSPTQKATNLIELILEAEQEQFQEHMKQQNGNLSQNKPFKYITNEEMLAQCLVFFTSGSDTVAITVSNAIYLLASNPDKQEKLYQSIVEKLSEFSGVSKTDPFDLITFETLKQFEYLDAAVNESLRVLSGTVAVDRVSSEDLRLETSDKKTWFYVKKGDVVRMSMLHMHQNPNHFSNPQKYVPERFLPNNDSGETCNKHAFLPFGVGPRNCLAKSLGLFEVKMAMIHLVRLFRFKICEETKLEYYRNLDAILAKQIRLKVEKRD